MAAVVVASYPCFAKSFVATSINCSRRCGALRRMGDGLSAILGICNREHLPQDHSCQRRFFTAGRGSATLGDGFTNVAIAAGADVAAALTAAAAAAAAGNTTPLL